MLQNFFSKKVCQQGKKMLTNFDIEDVKSSQKTGFLIKNWFVKQTKVTKMIKSYILFTTPFCKFCPSVKNFLSNINFHGSHIDATKDEGTKKAINFKVTKVPTVIFLDNSGNEVTRAHNIPEIRGILSDY